MDNPQKRSRENPSANGSENITFKGELLRKATHLCALSIPAIYYFSGKRVIVPLLLAALALSLAADMIRFYGGPKIKELFQSLFGIMIRPHETKDFTGATYILSSSIISILIFDKTVAILAIAYIAIGDTAGAIVGRLWGRIRFRKKTLEGTLGFLLSCCAVSLIIPGPELHVKLTGALAAAAVEALTFYIDDNLTVPLIAGALMQALTG